MEREEEGEGEGEGEYTPRALGATGFLTQEAEPIRTIIVDACNRFNKLSYLEIIWTAHHCWLARARFEFNFYKYWVNFLLGQPGESPVVLVSHEEVTQGDPLYMVVYNTTLVPLTNYLR